MNTGVAFAAGGIRGAAYAGVYQALQENGIDIDSASGMGTGAIAAGLLAAGYQPDDILEAALSLEKRLMGKTGAGRMLRNVLPFPGLYVKGLFGGNYLEQELGRRFARTGVTELKLTRIPLAVAAADADTGQFVTFVSNTYGFAQSKSYAYVDDAALSEAVGASCAVPGLIKPVDCGGRRLISVGDRGGFLVAPLKLMGAHRVLGVRTAGDRAVDVVPGAAPDYLLEIALPGIGPYDLGKAWQCYDAGYRQTKERIGELVLSLFEHE